MIYEKSTEILQRSHIDTKIEGLLIIFTFNLKLNNFNDFLLFLMLISPSKRAQIAKETPLLLTKLL